MVNEIEFKNVNFSYTQENKVLNDLSFNFPMNEWIAINGDYGSGKSTLVKLVLGLESPNSGKIIVNGSDIHEEGYEWYSQILKSVGHLLDEEGLLSNQSLFENLALPLIYHQNLSQADRETWISYLLGKFSLLGLQTERPAFVTDEVRRIVAILRSLVLKPSILILYNPFKGLGHMNQKRVLELLEEFEAQHNLKTVILVSEDSEVLNKKKMKKFELREGKLYEI